MIYDDTHVLPMYDPRFTKAVVFLARCTPDMEPGRYEIDGDDMYASVQAYETMEEEQVAVESHLRYIDIQTCLRGQESIDFFTVSELSLKGGDNAKDLIFYNPSGKGNRVEIRPGKAAVFYPHDAHRPSLHPAGGRENVKKVVVKIRVQS